MRRNFPFIILLTLLPASCRLQPASIPTNASAPTVTVPAHAPEIRFALIGEPRDVNVWELFDESGASYADYALRFEYWPRLYHLAPPELTFQPLAADGMPSSVIQEGEIYSATVKLRPDLKWTDDSAFTAEDVAFTVNTALIFELGFDWNAYYSSGYLSRAEVVDSSTVKFMFKQKPNVGVWQYGALQGPVVQKSFWGLMIEEASAFLPDDALRAQVEAARIYQSKVQAAVDDLSAQVNTLRFNGQSDHQLETSLTGNQKELIYAQNNLDQLLQEYDEKIKSARAALYALDDTDEPILGTWIPAGKQNDAWVNEINPAFPFIQPNFDRAVYQVFTDETAAVTALENNEVDAILTPNGISKDLVLDQFDDNLLLETTFNEAPRESYIAFNPLAGELADPVLRLTLYCVVKDIPSNNLIGSSIQSFVPSGNDAWLNPDAIIPCGEGDDRTKRSQILKSAGYSWDKEPTARQPGNGLVRPDGTAFPAVTLLVSSREYDLRPEIFQNIEESLRELGFPLTVQTVSADDLRYKVFSSSQYDMAVLNWRLSLYPAYLCDWFGAGGRFDYGSGELRSECEALSVDADLESARQHVFEIQSILAEDLPFIPLYADTRFDAYRNIRYPFESVLGGFGGLYGAPSRAMPAQ